MLEEPVVEEADKIEALRPGFPTPGEDSKVMVLAFFNEERLGGGGRTVHVTDRWGTSWYG